MSNTFMNVDDVATELEVSKSYAYKVVQKLNEDMKSLGYLTIAGRVNKQYFMKKVCYSEKEERK
jgi:predicted transcriptional regulator